MRHLAAIWFEASGTLTDFRRLARVLAASASEHCPDWQRAIVCGGPASREGGTGVLTHIVNTQKLEAWTAIVDAAADGEELLLLDVDTLIVRPLDDIWTRPFDLAYTVKPGADPPFNLGAVFLRVSARTRAFVQAWRDGNRALFRPGFATSVWRRKYGGINQAAFGQLLEAGAPAVHGLALETLPCAEWNCEDTSWATFDPAVTRILHLKGALRASVLHGEARAPECVAPYAFWIARDQEARRAAAR